jgi:hypothetical protein
MKNGKIVSKEVEPLFESSHELHILVMNVESCLQKMGLHLLKNL